MIGAQTPTTIVKIKPKSNQNFVIFHLKINKQQ